MTKLKQRTVKLLIFLLTVLLSLPIPVWNLIQVRMVTTFLSLISGINVFDYIDRVHVKMPVFYNFMYSLDLQQTVLRPYCNISDFQIWDYYLAEELRHGPSYDYVRTHHMFSRILNFLFVVFSRIKLSFWWK